MPSSVRYVLVAALAAAAVQGLPHTSSSASAAEASVVAAANKALSQDLFNEPTSVDRFKKLLTFDGATLLSPEVIQERVVFDFNKAAAAPGAEGMLLFL